MENPEQVEQEEKLFPQPSPKKKHWLIGIIAVGIIVVGGAFLILSQFRQSSVNENELPTTARTSDEEENTAEKQEGFVSNDFEKAIKRLPPGKVFFPTTDENIWNFDEDPILRALQDVYGDTYDFAILFPTKNIGNSKSQAKNIQIEGIGAKKQESDFTDIKHMAIINMHAYYPNPSKQVIENPPPIWIELILHELGHYWCCNVNETITPDSAHWARNLDLFDGNSRYTTVMGDGLWIRKDSQAICVDSFSAKDVFSDFALYFMGLISSEEVAPIRIHHFEGEEEEKRGIFATDYFGPNCYESPSFLSTDVYYIEDFIASYGKRVPGYQEEQKSFSTVFIIVEGKDSPPSKNFLDLIGQYRKELPQAWVEVTHGGSTLRVTDSILQFDEITYSLK